MFVISVGPAAGIAIAKEGIAVAKEGIETLDKGLDLYHKQLDKIIPWEEFNITVTKLNQYRSNYSTKAGALIGEVQTKLMDGMDAYSRATQNIYQWSGLAIDLLEPYKELFDGVLNQDLYTTQRQIIIQLLEQGIAKMEMGKAELAASSSSFNVAHGKLTELNRRLKDDFNENSEYYNEQISHIRAVGYRAAAPFSIFGLAIAAGVIEGKLIPDLNAKMREIEKFYDDIENEIQLSKININLTKGRLTDEITHIGELQNKAIAAQVFVRTPYTETIKKTLLKSVDNLLIKCRQYRERHQDKVQSK